MSVVVVKTYIESLETHSRLNLILRCLFFFQNFSSASVKQKEKLHYQTEKVKQKIAKT